MFVELELGSGHYSFKVFWRRVSDDKPSRIPWLQEAQKPSADLAFFYARMFGRIFHRSLVIYNSLVFSYSFIRKYH